MTENFYSLREKFNFSDNLILHNFINTATEYILIGKKLMPGENMPDQPYLPIPKYLENFVTYEVENKTVSRIDENFRLPY